MRRRFTTRATVAILCCFALALLVPASAVAGGSCYTFNDSERSFAKKTNAARVNAGKAKLKLDPHLSKVAIKHTREMASKDLLFHTPSTKLGNRVTNWIMLGENVGYGGSVKTVQKAFMNSAGHKANILNGSYKYFGIGVVKSDGVVWVTVIFEAKSDPGTTLKMPSC